MSIFRSHLFPHITYIFALALVCVIGMSRLRDALGAMELLSTQRNHAILLVSPTDPQDPEDTPAPEQASLLGEIRKHMQPAVFHFDKISKTVEFREFGILTPDEDLVDDDLKMCKFHMDEMAKATDRALVEIAFLSDKRSGQRLTTFARKFRDLCRIDGLDELVRALKADGFEDRIKAMGDVINDVERQALLDISAVAIRQDEAFKELHRTVMYTFIWLTVLSIAYLYAVNSLLARPIKSLSSIARTVTAGRLLVRARLSTGGPVAELGEDFNRMVDMLVKSLNEQQRAVAKLKKRTGELQAANEHKNRFIANISHELKTPLNAVIGFADILLAQHHGQLSERQEDYLRRIHHAGTHLLEMICDLIDVMKLDLDALQLKNEKFDIAKLTREVTEMMMAQVEKKNHELIVTISKDIEEVEQDPTRYKQIMMNLISNAVKFTPEGGMIEVELRKDEKFFVLIVRDNGIGVSKRDQRRIFQDFIQLDSRLHRQHEGTGIGLALTRRLVELMGGFMELDSVPEEGSTFTVNLPLSIHDPKLKVPDKISKAKETERGKGVLVTARRMNVSGLLREMKSSSSEESSSI